MANITFSSPSLSRDVTVYAVAGDRGTILAVAKANKIPIPFDCQDGECGSCLVEVQILSQKRPYGVALTEKEKEALRQLGKITKDEIKEAEVNDIPPLHRLACQCFVRNEDILVKFAGDETIPAQPPHLSIAAKVYKGAAIEIASVDDFLAHAIKVEEDAAQHFDGLAASMELCGNAEVAKLFRQLSGYSRLHLNEAKSRAKGKDLSAQVPPDYVWPDHVTPERTSLLAGDADLSRLDALRAALTGEKRGYEFYYAVAGTSKLPDVVAMAKEFVKEEADHVKVLEAWIAREEWLSKSHAV
ncbi:2Fe-2S iron-sulfur cluster-binding protein [Rhodoblastus sp. 17X3]|uniref:2Fe-2S iron-sulfur cluster-binding protein n=1 Tax=Rhodoblastus sp. 17X3 TaxID=3047026 RepID=UPI0024B7AE15|nr:2Fe-2S iron-sulfur cluster-binding protein [Rhodoblastus sp. 17X3]MDI9848202.1 2Fe-2S iron-sulfur cluster-binding protein [Rhodoblastus sp. 17X3]